MPPKPPPSPNSWPRLWLLKSLLPLALAAIFLGGVIWAGRWGVEYLRGQDRYELAFADIACDPPPMLTKERFFDEVRFVSRLPARLNLTDDDLAKKLRAGFAKHHWVEQVDAVEIKPPKQVIVRLTYRTPVLAVKVDETLRAVDGHGVLLYTDAPTAGLPIFAGTAKPPQGAAGTPWGDPAVEAAARKLRK